MPEESKITAEWIDQKLTEHFPRVAEDLPSLTKLAEKVQWYANEVGRAPSLEQAVGWASALESELRGRAEAEAAEHQRQQEQIEAHERERAAFPEEQAPFMPEREYSEAELDAMDSDTYRRLILGVTNRIEDRQGNSGSAYLKPERLERRVRKIKFSEEQLAAEAYRKRVIQADAEARKRVKQDLQRAIEAQRGNR